MTRTRAPHHLSWEQLTLVPPALVTAELTLYYDGRSDALQTAWRIRCTETDAVIGMEVSATASNARDTQYWTLNLASRLLRGSGRLV